MTFKDGWPYRSSTSAASAKCGCAVLRTPGRRASRLVPDALDLPLPVFKTSLKQKKSPIQAVLLDQGVLAGVGNIYAQEALFLCGIRPARKAHRLSAAEIGALHARSANDAACGDHGARIQQPQLSRCLRPGRFGTNHPCRLSQDGFALPALQNISAWLASGGARHRVLPQMPVMKKKRWVVGLTGGVASGKSTVLKLLERRGIPSVSSDPLARPCMHFDPGTPAYRAIPPPLRIRHLRAPGWERLDRRTAGVSASLRPCGRTAASLERIVHPCVIRGLKTFARAHAGLIILEIPLLFESRLESLVDEIVVVHATRRQQIERGMARA